MKNYSVLCLLLVFPLEASLSCEWDYSRAIRSAQDEQWEDAQQRMSALMIHDPDNPELLYDSGVASYRVKEYPKAEAYFYQTAHNELAAESLKEKAYFNLGNTKVALNNLEEAIEPYESALAIDPDDEQARHNLEQVRKALEQQEQEQEQQDQNQQNQDEQNDQSNQDQQQQQQPSDSPGDQNDSQDQENGQQEGRQEQQKNGQDGEEQDRQESTANDEQKQDADKQQDGDRKEDAAEKSDSEQAPQDQDQRRDTHDSSPQKNGEQDDTQQARDADIQNRKEGEKSQEMQAGELLEQEGIEDKLSKQQKEMEEGLDPQDRWMVRVLRQREQADEKANKQIVKTMIDKELAGQDGQNCW